MDKDKIIEEIYEKTMNMAGGPRVEYIRMIIELYEKLKKEE